jgi:hypothetical protein
MSTNKKFPPQMPSNDYGMDLAAINIQGPILRNSISAENF